MRFLRLARIMEDYGLLGDRVPTDCRVCNGVIHENKEAKTWRVAARKLRMGFSVQPSYAVLRGFHAAHMCNLDAIGAFLQPRRSPGCGESYWKYRIRHAATGKDNADIAANSDRSGWGCLRKDRVARNKHQHATKPGLYATEWIHEIHALFVSLPV